MIIKFLRKKLAEIKSKKIANCMIGSMHTVTNSGSGPGIKTTLKSMKKTGIKKVELVCPERCQCCSNMFNKIIPIENAVELPRPDCPLHKCLGRYAAIVEFDIN